MKKAYRGCCICVSIISCLSSSDFWADFD
jgi:hypothetical protein